MGSWRLGGSAEPRRATTRRSKPWIRVFGLGLGHCEEVLAMKVYEAVANAFIKEGTTAVFGLLGDAQIGWWSEMAKHPNVKIVDVRHEGASLSMAEGWGRVAEK